MGTQEMLILKLEIIEKVQEAQSKQIDKILDQILNIRLQDQRIESNQKSIKLLWKKHDDSFGQEGVVTSIKEFQSGCPRERFKGEFKVLWGALAVIVTLIGALKFFGGNISG